MAEGIKHDVGKPPINLIPRAAIEGTARVFGFGAAKYDRWNWANGMNWSRLIDAAMRHIVAFNDGEDKDKESTELHLYHALCCLSMLAVYYERGLGKDDRIKWEDIIKK